MITCRTGPHARTPPLDPAPEEPALAAVFAEVAPGLTSRLFLVLGNWEDARDAAQTAVLRCWRSRDRLGAVRDVRAWLFRIAYNVAYDLRRQARVRRAVSLDALEDTIPVPTEAAAEEEAVSRERLDLLRAALDDLRPAEREVFVLRQQAGLTYEEIAADRARPVGTVKTLMRRAVRKLCARFARYRAA